jgi:hypothetical protein
MLRVFNAKQLTVKALPVELGVQMRQVALFTLKGRTLNPVAQIAMECIRVTGRSLSAQARR